MGIFKFSQGRLKKWQIILLVLFFSLIIVRICLPFIVKKYVNRTLSQIPDYYGQVEDIDIALYRGAYKIHGLYLNKKNANSSVKFLDFPETDISIEWRAILRGKVVAEIYMSEPAIIYVREDMESDDRTTEEDWTKALTDLVPIDINHLEIENGKIAFVEIAANPSIDLQLNQFKFLATNLRNVIAKEGSLPSEIVGEAQSIGNGTMTIDGSINLLKEVPDMDIAVSLKNAKLSALNDLTSHYGNIDFEEGNLELFSEIAIADSFLKGYFKLLLNDTEFVGNEDEKFEELWEGFAAFFLYLFKNRDTKKFGVKAPVEGNLSDIDTSVYCAIVSIFKNAFIQAFKAEIDDEIEYEDAYNEHNSAIKTEEEKNRKWWQFWKRK